MATYSDEDYQPVMDFYNRLPEDKKRVAGEILNNFKKRYKEGDAPPEEMLSSLKALASKKEGGLEAKAKKSEENKSPSGWLPTQQKAAFGLATIVLALAAVYTLGAAPLVAATYALPLY